MAEDQPVALYRHFDADGHLLYVGISLSAVARLAQHRDGSTWFGEIASVTIQWLPSRLEALAAERHAIRTERPSHNTVRFQYERRRISATASRRKLPALSPALKVELEARLSALPVQAEFNLDASASILGIRRGTLRRLLGSGIPGSVKLEAREIGFIAQRLVAGRAVLDPNSSPRNLPPAPFYWSTNAADAMAGYTLTHADYKRGVRGEEAWLKRASGARP